MATAEFDILKVSRTCQYSLKENKDSLSLTLALPHMNFIELGKNHIAASAEKIRVYGIKDKKQSSISAYIRNIEDDSEKVNDLYHATEQHIGVIYFYEEDESEFGYEPPKLTFNIKLPSKSFQQLINQLNGGISPVQMSIDCECLEYASYSGYDLRWDFDLLKEKRPSSNINEVSFISNFMERTELDVLNEKEQKQHEIMNARVADATDTKDNSKFIRETMKIIFLGIGACWFYFTFIK